eukprot:GDKH01013273.1.p1 GENE.GDKH01013273.1~~GDKH01013273.1.p1  ORF type:complete len:68 (+),score=1.37 GDKH01013273.1:138-341(+)
MLCGFIVGFSLFSSGALSGLLTNFVLCRLMGGLPIFVLVVAFYLAQFFFFLCTPPVFRTFVCMCSPA